MDFDYLDNFPPYEKTAFFNGHLRPCPFCGSINVKQKIIHTEKYKPCTIYFVKCEDCSAQGPTTKYIGDPVMGAQQQIEMENLSKELWGINCTKQELLNFGKYLNRRYNKYD